MSNSLHASQQEPLWIEEKNLIRRQAMAAIIARHIWESISSLQAGVQDLVNQLKDHAPAQPIEFGEWGRLVISWHLDIEKRVFVYVISESQSNKITDAIANLFRTELSSPVPSRSEQDDAYRQYAESNWISFNWMGSTGITLTISADEFLTLLDQKANILFEYIITEIFWKQLLELKSTALLIERKLFWALQDTAHGVDRKSENILTDYEEQLRLDDEVSPPIQVDTDVSTPICLNLSLYGTGIPSNQEKISGSDISVMPLLRRRRQPSHIQNMVFSPSNNAQISWDGVQQSSNIHWTEAQPLHWDFRSIINIEKFVLLYRKFLDSLSTNQDYWMSYELQGDTIEWTDTPQRVRFTLLSTDEVAENIRKKTLQDTQDRTSDTVANIIWGSRWGQLVSYLKVRLVALASKLV